MKLRTINGLLKHVGLVLVVSVDDERDWPVEMWLESRKGYLKRCEEEQAKEECNRK